MSESYDFLAEDNLCGQTLLKLVSRGNSIVAELMRLSYHIPRVFLGPDAVKNADELKYLRVLFDFSYLKAPDNYERKVNADLDLVDIDDEFQENHLKIMGRFYVLFQNICKFIADFNEFLERLDQGFFISHSVEDILLNVDGKQLMCESLYLFGVMLLTLDRLVPGPARERIVVAYLRYRGESALENLEEVTKLCRSTGFVPGLAPPAKYPESFFARFAVPQRIVHMIIDRLRSDDVYRMIKMYPSPEHRSTALSNQAAMLYVILFFAPDILHKRRTTMREIVDKHFNDNWILTLYMGWVVNLREEWARYKAARDALKNTLQVDNLTDFAEQQVDSLAKCEKLLSGYLVEGVLEEDFVLDNISRLMHCLRKCNATVRWLMLHYRATDPAIRKVVVSPKVSQARVLQVLLYTAQLEWKLRKTFKHLLDTKEERWERCKKQVSERMSELADYFSGERALTRVKKNEELQGWFVQLSKEVQELDYSRSRKAGRKIQKIIEALKQVEFVEAIDTSLQIKEFLSHSRDFLTQMVRAVNVKDEVLTMMLTVADFSYAWEIISDYIAYLHELVEKNPSSVVLLRATFQKLSAVLEVPLIRINQAGSSDVVSVAQYYSGELVLFVRRVLEVIPKNVFRILHDLIGLQTSHMRPLPVKLELIHVKQFAQLDQRYLLAKGTHQISVFTEGVLKMEETLLGVIQVDPKQVLEDGIRKELVFRVAEALHKALVFGVDPKSRDRKRKKAVPITVTGVERALDSVKARLDGFRRSFEYIQDYINMYGLKIWQEECGRIFMYNVEQECNRYVKKKILDSQSTHQSRAIPIPVFPRMDAGNKYPNFMGRLTRALLAITDARLAVYSPECCGWYAHSGAEIAGASLFSRVNRSLGVLGLQGIDRVLQFRVVRGLQRFTSFVKSAIMATKRGAQLGQFLEALSPLHTVPSNAGRIYEKLRKTMHKEVDAASQWILRVGQCQLMRKAIAHELNFSCKVDSHLLHNALETFNDAVLRDIRSHYRDIEKPYPSKDNEVLTETTRYLSASGFNDPLTKIYVTNDKIEVLPLFLFAFVHTQLSALVWDPQFGTLIKNHPSSKSKDRRLQVDGAPIAACVVTILRQFHPGYTTQFLGLCGQFVRATVHVAFAKVSKPSALPEVVKNMLLFLDLYVRMARMPRKALEGYIPSYIFDSLKI